MYRFGTQKAREGEGERESERDIESVPNRANRQTNNFSSRKCLRTWIGKLH